MSKHQKIIEQINAGLFSREKLRLLEINARKLLVRDPEVQSVLNAIDQSVPSDKRIIFMGFCPGADFAKRQDIEWREKGICTFDFYDSERQLERFRSISPGDLVVLKKREKFGKSMQLYGYGRVKRVDRNTENNRFLIMEWSDRDEVIEVPLMGCNSTVDIRTLETIESEAPEIFDWLKLK